MSWRDCVVDYVEVRYGARDDEFDIWRTTVGANVGDFYDVLCRHTDGLATVTSTLLDANLVEEKRMLAATATPTYHASLASDALLHLVNRIHAIVRSPTRTYPFVLLYFKSTLSETQ